jgi:hypothetical protein
MKATIIGVNNTETRKYLMVASVSELGIITHKGIVEATSTCELEEEDVLEVKWLASYQTSKGREMFRVSVIGKAKVAEPVA